MKKLPAVIFALILFGFNLSAAGQVTVKSELKSVKVFLRGAELNQSAAVKLEKGMNEVIITGFARNAETNSINVSASGNVVILSVSQKLDYLKDIEKSAAVKSLEDSVEILSKTASSLKDDSEVLYAEYDMITSNKTIGGQNVKVTPADLDRMSAYFRKKLGEIRKEISATEQKIKKNEKNLDRIKKQLAEINALNEKPVNELVLNVSARNTGNVIFNISYLIQNAGWTPYYDLRVAKKGEPIDFHYKANITQNSGFDWNDAEIILSTRNPVQNNIKPELNTWFIDFMRKPVAYRDVKMNTLQKSLSVAASEMSQPEAGMADYFEAEQKQLAVEFKPSVRYDIPSDGKQHLVDIQQNKIDASYEYYAVPKLDNSAYLMAAVTGWNELNLLPGEAGVYFENSFTGKTFINPSDVKDTLLISLGKDKGISVDKERLKDFTEDKFLSSDVERTFAYDIKIKNNKTAPVEISVEDQIPVSMNEDITVKLIDDSGAVYDSATGKVTWKVSVDPSKSVSKRLVFSVRFPKDQLIPNL